VEDSAATVPDFDLSTAEAPQPSSAPSTINPPPPAPAASLKKCCIALRQNAASSPNKEYMLSAASLCDSMLASGASQGALRSAVRTALKGTPLPEGVCY
jgi:hypothetical protein